MTKSANHKNINITLLFTMNNRLTYGSTIPVSICVGVPVDEKDVTVFDNDGDVICVSSAVADVDVSVNVDSVAVKCNYEVIEAYTVPKRSSKTHFLQVRTSLNYPPFRKKYPIQE